MLGGSGWTVWARVCEGAADRDGGGEEGVMSVCGASLDYPCRWQIQVSVYRARRFPAHLRCTQCSILLYFFDICFLTCIWLWQIS